MCITLLTHHMKKIKEWEQFLDATLFKIMSKNFTIVVKTKELNLIIKKYKMMTKHGKRKKKTKENLTK